MSESQREPADAEELPKAKIKNRKWTFPVVWVIPIIAAAVAGYLVYGRLQEFGPRITIRFKDGSGIRAGQTPIKYRGVPIGEVRAVELSQDQQYVLVKAQLRRSAASIARGGARFWIVRPELGFGNISGLGTVITGPEIEVFPGSGKAQTEFVGLEGSPAALEKGLRIVLVTGRLEALRVNSPVYYRGVEVGTVQDVQLSANAATVNIHVVIRPRYARLVRNGSKFWNVSGIDVNLGLFRGLEVSIESLRSLAAGGIAFATPNDPEDKPSKDGMVFPLYDKPAKEWLQWAPKIPLAREADVRGKGLKPEGVQDAGKRVTEAVERLEAETTKHEKKSGSGARRTDQD
ncbi:MAG: intermembrane transport protein PqiB [Candidatus Binatia bacterium]